MRGLALIIGNSNYKDNQLKNPINDAEDLSDKLKTLGFIVKCHTDIDIEALDTHVSQFGKDLEGYDIGLFYFAGHGMQIEGENIITATNTNFDSEISAKYSSLAINKVLAYMERASNDTNIIILDACRDNPYERSWSRSVNQQGLAPMYAPKGTLIAYATSPGETASDGQSRNGLYTSALLKHIEEPNISIEEFFKRVRNSVFAFSNGKQTSWEHTSLTGDFKFNSGILMHSAPSSYSDDAIADDNFNIHSQDEVTKIIKQLKKYDWYKQSPAMDNVNKLNAKNNESNKLFVLGRNILQTAEGGEYTAIDFMENLEDRLDRFSYKGYNHVLNGMLFEMYFNTFGIFRNDKLKNTFQDLLFALDSNEKFKSSFEFIFDQLKPFEKDVFYIPGKDKSTISLDLIFEKVQNEEVYILRDIKHEGISVLINDNRNPFFGADDEFTYDSMYYSRIKNTISEISNIPYDKISITPNFDLNKKSLIQFPYGREISKRGTKN